LAHDLGQPYAICAVGFRGAVRVRRLPPGLFRWVSASSKMRSVRRPSPAASLESAIVFADWGMPVRIIVQLPNLASAVVYSVTVQLIHTPECAIMRGTEPRQRQPRAHHHVKTWRLISVERQSSCSIRNRYPAAMYTPRSARGTAPSSLRSSPDDSDPGNHATAPAVTLVTSHVTAVACDL
jgi:hypothetical protein